MDTERRLIDLPDGREIDLLLAGPADGLPLLVHDGTPVGLVLYPPTVQAARDRNLRPILMARPGYERSTPRPGRRVADVAADVTAVLDALGPGYVRHGGLSAAGRTRWPARRCCPDAASRPPRSPGPPRTPRRDWTGLAGMARRTLGVRGPRRAGGSPTWTARRRLGALTGSAVAAALGGLIADADRAVLTGAYADHLAAGARASLSAGIAGWRDDDLAFVTDWGFSRGRGSAGRHLAGRPGPDGPVRPRPVAGREHPGARAHLMAGEGHLTIGVSGIGRILDDVLDLGGVGSNTSSDCSAAPASGMPTPRVRAQG